MGTISGGVVRKVKHVGIAGIGGGEGKGRRAGEWGRTGEKDKRRHNEGCA